MKRLLTWSICLAVMVHSIESNFVDLSQYHRQRNDLLTTEIDSIFGSDIILTEKEHVANKIVMQAKEHELKIGAQKPHLFNPSQHIFEVLKVVNQSKLFQIIRKMPKGGLLHAHDSAVCSVDYLVSLTYWPHLWQRMSRNNSEIKEFRFSRKNPQNLLYDSFDDINGDLYDNIEYYNNEDKSNDVWRLVSDVRKEMGASKYDQMVRKTLTLLDNDVDPRLQFRNSNEAWRRFNEIFIKVIPLLSYAPGRKQFYQQIFKEMLDDNVQYLEFRSSLRNLYDLDGNVYTAMENVNIIQEALDEFKQKNPLFVSSKFIYAPSKISAGNSTHAQFYFDLARKLHAKHPELMVGFDLVGPEDISPQLISVAEQILQLPKDLKFFFHAGETNWFGSVDENLIDAILMGSHRIGHGYALTKHQKLIELVKRKNIAIEVSPISNQVLKLVDDYRNHPASVFMAQNVSIVIASDDPGFWGTLPLSHDFYITFLGIASSHSDLRTLKKLAINSIQHSSLKSGEKFEAMLKWQTQWDKFIDDLVEQEAPHKF